MKLKNYRLRYEEVELKLPKITKKKGGRYPKLVKLEHLEPTGSVLNNISKIKEK